MAFELYKHFDEEGNLLYIGISHSAFMRLAGHKRDSNWFDDISYVDIYRYNSIAELRKAERELIFLEKPKHNKVHKNYINPDLLHRMVMGRTWSRNLTFDEVCVFLHWEPETVLSEFPPMNPESDIKDRVWCPIEAAHIMDEMDADFAADMRDAERGAA